MRINNNLMAMNTHRQLGLGSTNGAKSMEKLSSGFRINRAGDDAAGLAISEKMRGQIRGLNQASRNAQDGISLIQTAEGALNETHAILQRMRELAVQSSNDTNNDTDRGEIQKEIEQLKSEITRIATDTEFNTKTLLNGDLSTSASSASAYANTAIKSAKVTNDNMKEDTYQVITTAITKDVTTIKHNSTDATAVAIDTAGADIKLGTYTLESKENSGNNANLDYILKDANGQQVGTTITAAKTATTVTVGGFDFTVTDTAGNTNGVGTLQFTLGVTATFEVKDSAGTSLATKTVTNDTTGKVELGGIELTFTNAITAGTDSDVAVKNNSVSFQIGANEGQKTALAVSDMGSVALGINNVDVSNKTGAQTAITTVQTAIESVSSERSKLGAIQNRLEHTIKNLDTSSENLQASESRIRDVDMAKEMMEFTKNNILQQAAQAMLAQANQAPQGVLQLLR